MNVKQVVILVGGLGTRLKSLTKKTPKPLIKVNGKPFLYYLINYYAEYKISKIILLTKYKHQTFFKRYHNKKFNNLKIKCFREKNFLGTAGSLRNVLKILDKRFVYCNGDTFFNINLFKFQTKLKKNQIGILACSVSQNNEKRFTTFKNDNKKLISS